MIMIQASNEELIKDVNDHREKLLKQAEEALDANKEEAEEIEKYHGEDTKKPVSNKQLKAMHLSEALFEDLEEDDYFDFEHDVYDAIKRECLKSYNRYLSLNQIKTAVLSFLDRIEDDEEFTEFFNQTDESSQDIPGFEDTKELWDKLTSDMFEGYLTEALTRQMTPEENKMVNKILSGPYKDIVEIAFGPATFGDGKALPKELMEFVFDYMLNKMYPSDASITEELSQGGQKVLDELKKELGPELQKKVAYVIKDYAANQAKQPPKKSEENETNESLQEDVKRYSDVIPYEKRKYWYFTTHGIGPGTIPSDLTVLETRQGQNDKGTSGDYVCLDGVLNTSELKKYDMTEAIPPTESLHEDYTSNIQTLKLMHAVMQAMNNEDAYMTWINVMPDEPMEEDFEWIAENDFTETVDFFNRVYKRYHKDGLVAPNQQEIDFCNQKDAELGLPAIQIVNVEVQ